MSDIEDRDCVSCGDVFQIDGGKAGHFAMAGEQAGHRFTGPMEARRNPTRTRGWTCRLCVGASPEQIQANRVAVALKS